MFTVVTREPRGSCTVVAQLHIYVCVQTSLVLEQDPSFMDCDRARSQYINSLLFMSPPYSIQASKILRNCGFFYFEDCSEIVPAACELPMLKRKS